MNLSPQLQQEATQFAQRQGISLDQFVLWAVAEKVGTSKKHGLFLPSITDASAPVERS